MSKGQVSSWFQGPPGPPGPRGPAGPNGADVSVSTMSNLHHNFTMMR